ncbi:Uncharacterised protein [uncultured archaeon]|nr:Uncharacterised protein [uncultured archaeon]
MATEADVKELFGNVEKITSRKEMDLSADADLSIGIMNLVSLEEHMFSTAIETQKDEYLDLLREIRGIRVELLKEIVKEYEGEIWCISKHLLAASMRLTETGTKMLEVGEKDKAKSLFKKSYRLFSMFWELNTRSIYSGDPQDSTDPQRETAPNQKESDVIDLSSGRNTEGMPTDPGDKIKESGSKEKVVFVPVCKESL